MLAANMMVAPKFAQARAKASSMPPRMPRRASGAVDGEEHPQFAGAHCPRDLFQAGVHFLECDPGRTHQQGKRHHPEGDEPRPAT